MSVSEIADNYERDYGFMALNATMKHAQMSDKVHADFLIDELKGVYDELLRRGHKLITSKQEYEEAVAIHGTPKAFQP